MCPDSRRLATALLLSLLVHALLLSLNFGTQELGFPGFGFPWQERRIAVPELRVVLVPPRAVAAGPAARPVAELLQRAPAGPPVAAVRPVHGPSESTTQPSPKATDTIARQADLKAEAATQDAFASSPADATAPLDGDGTSEATPAPIPEPVVVALERLDEAAWVVPPAASAPSPVAAAAPGASSPAALEAARLEAERLETDRQAAVRREVAEHEAARQEAARAEDEQLEAQRLEAQRLEAETQAATRREAAEQEAARQKSARVQAERLEAERLEAARQTAARRALEQETARQEAARAQVEQLEAAQRAAARDAAARQEVARQEAARVQAERLEAERLEAARQTAARRALEQETARQEAARAQVERLEAAQRAAVRDAAAQQEVARQEAARGQAERLEAERLQAERKETERREAARRAMGRQLDEEAAQRGAAATAARQPDTRPYSLGTARRGRLWGRTDANVELVLYAEALARKIEFNTTVAVVSEVAKRPHRDPLVTVALRRDGSVESVTFDISSGVTEIDETIRRIVQSQVPYQAFPPGLARDFDVIEIRRTWYFDVAVRLY